MWQWWKQQCSLSALSSLDFFSPLSIPNRKQLLCSSLTCFGVQRASCSFRLSCLKVCPISYTLIANTTYSMASAWWGGGGVFVCMYMCIYFLKSPLWRERVAINKLMHTISTLQKNLLECTFLVLWSRELPFNIQWRRSSTSCPQKNNKPKILSAKRKGSQREAPEGDHVPLFPKALDYRIPHLLQS